MELEEVGTEGSRIVGFGGLVEDVTSILVSGLTFVVLPDLSFGELGLVVAEVSSLKKVSVRIVGDDGICTYLLEGNFLYSHIHYRLLLDGGDHIYFYMYMSLVC